MRKQLPDRNSADQDTKLDRRTVLLTGGGVAVAAAAIGTAEAQEKTDPYAPPKKGALPPSTMKLDAGRTALVITDPHIDFLHPTGATWGGVGESVKEHDTVKNIGRLFAAAKAAGMTVAVSPHYYYPTDHGWRFEGALEKLMHKIGIGPEASGKSRHGRRVI